MSVRKFEWNHHTKVWTPKFQDFLRNELFIDLIIQAKDKAIKCHPIILASASEYLCKILKDNQDKTPTKLLIKSIEYKHLILVIRLLYYQTVQVEDADVDGFLNAAKKLKIDKFNPISQPTNREKSIAAALIDIENQVCTVRQAALKHKIPERTIYYRIKRLKMNKTLK